MGKFVTALFRLLLHTYNVELTNGGGGTNSAGINSLQVGYLTKLVISLSCALLQSLGESFIIDLCVLQRTLLLLRLGNKLNVSSSLYIFFVYYLPLQAKRALAGQQQMC